jgi:hypothetical protein
MVPSLEYSPEVIYLHNPTYLEPAPILVFLYIFKGFMLFYISVRVFECFGFSDKGEFQTGTIAPRGLLPGHCIATIQHSKLCRNLDATLL